MTNLFRDEATTPHALMQYSLWLSCGAVQGG